jgi:hypothetical protein
MSSAKMKITTWNCNMAFRKNASFILKQKPDILAWVILLALFALIALITAFF